MTEQGPARSLVHGHRETYDRELETIQAEIVQIGTYVEEAVHTAIEAMQTHDAELAARVIADDRRINELQEKVSELITTTIATQQPPLRRYVFLPRMGELVAGMVHDIIVALVEVDEVRARTVASRDDEVDRLYHASFDVVLDLMRADPDNVDRGTRILFAAHYLERIGDRVTNIAEDVLFLAGGVVEDLN